VEARGLTVRSSGEFEAELFVKDLRAAGLSPKAVLEARVRLFFKDGTALESKPVELAGLSSMVGVWAGTAQVTFMDRDFILSKNLDGVTDERSAGRAARISHSNRMRLHGYEYYKVRDAHRLSFTIEPTAANPANIGLMEGKYFVSCAYHDLRLLPQLFRPFTDKREGDVQVVVGANHFFVSRKDTIKEHGLNNIWEWSANGSASGDTMRGTFAVKENGVQTFAGSFEVKKIGGR